MRDGDSIKMRMSKPRRKESTSEEWRLHALRCIVALFAALVVSLTLTAAASADVSFTKAYGWGVSDGASQFETCTSTCQAGILRQRRRAVRRPRRRRHRYLGRRLRRRQRQRADRRVLRRRRVHQGLRLGRCRRANQFETCTSTCQAGIAGGGAGQFDDPAGVATDSSGDVYVADYDNEPDRRVLRRRRRSSRPTAGALRRDQPV